MNHFTPCFRTMVGRWPKQSVYIMLHICPPFLSIPHLKQFTLVSINPARNPSTDIIMSTTTTFTNWPLPAVSSTPESTLDLSLSKLSLTDIDATTPPTLVAGVAENEHTSVTADLKHGDPSCASEPTAQEVEATRKAIAYLNSFYATWAPSTKTGDHEPTEEEIEACIQDMACLDPDYTFEPTEEGCSCASEPTEEEAQETRKDIAYLNSFSAREPGPGEASELELEIEPVD